MRLHPARERLALLPREPVGRVGVCRVDGPPFREADAAAAEKEVDSLEPRAAVDVGAVVGVAVERDELPAGLVAQPEQELVEDLGPGRRVQDGAVGENAVEIEDARADAAPQAEHRDTQGGRREPRLRCDARCMRELSE